MEGADKRRLLLTSFPEYHCPLGSSQPHVRMMKDRPYLRGFSLPFHMEILFGSRMLTECEQTPGIDVDPLQTLTDGVIIFLTEAEAPGLRRSFVRIMDIPPQTSFQIARQHSVVCSTMNLHTARSGLMHEPFSPFNPDGTESKVVVVLPAVLPEDRILEHLNPAGRERW